MAINVFNPDLGTVSMVPTWPNAGPPTSGASGTLAGYAQKSDLLIDTTNAVTYMNTGTQASPTWTPTNLGATSATVSPTTGLIATRIPLSRFLAATGVPMAAAASSTVFGITVALATSLILTGTPTSSGSQANQAIVEVTLPPNYIAASNITLTVEGYYTNTSSTASVHTCTAAAYLNTIAGAQGATLIATAAQTIPITTAGAMTFTITGATLVPGAALTLSITTNMTNAGGASTAFITGVSFT